jgi:creatinine amidohydrolase/Fe(II)-dependent formamide hydrolase-like protein
MLALAGDRVATPSHDFEPIRVQRDPFSVVEMPPSGVLGDPTAGTKEAGDRFLEAAASALARKIDAGAAVA